MGLLIKASKRFSLFGVGKALIFLMICYLNVAFAQQSITSVSGYIHQTDTAKQAVQNRAKQLKSSKSQQTAATIILEPATEAELAPLTDQVQSKKVMIGIGRVLPAPYDQSVQQSTLSKEQLADGGLVTTLAVTSPDAKAIRLQFVFDEFPQGVELRFYSPLDPANAIGPVTQNDLILHLNDLRRAGEVDSQDLAAAPYWSPLITGDTIAVEIYTPAGISADKLQFSIPILSHLITAPMMPDFAKDIQDIGSSGSCNIDVACVNSLSDVTRDSVGKYVFTVSGGFSSLCTGTVLNDIDPSSAIPYFLTANHCLSTQTEASSMEFFWFFQLQVCGAPSSGSISQQSGGALLLSTGRNNDHTLVRLNQSPPGGVGFAGWSANSISTNTSVTGVHHPSGDLKKFSSGTITGFEPFATGGINMPSAIEVVWSAGTTEPGSSGSGLFLQDGSNFFLVGTLSGGFASCSFLQGPDFYGRFAQMFPLLEEFLAPDVGGPSELLIDAFEN